MVNGADGLILSDDARSILEPLLADCGEFWRVSVHDRTYWWFNCLACVEALDRSATDADWGVVDGAWGSFRWITLTRRLAFEVDRVEAAPALFRVPEYPQGILFAGDALVDVVERHGLTGFQFDLIWSSEQGGVIDPQGVSLAGIFDGIDREELDRKRSDAASILKTRSKQVD